MMQISLSGKDWLFKDYIGEDWRWRDAHKPGTRDVRFWRRGSVPGSVHNDLWTLGEIPNPYFERNSLLLEWIPARTWLYKKTFAVDEALRGKRIQLSFEGVDYEAEFFLNGESLGSHRGMYTPAMFEVGERLHYGEENLIAVVIEPAPHEQPQVGRTSKVRTHKSRMTYWWDFCPRMVHLGIWQNVLLDVTGNVRLEDVFARPQLNNNFTRADVSISVELDAIQAQVIEVATMIRLAGSIVASQRARQSLAPGRTTLDYHLTVDQPRLWWTNGVGDQPLYEAEICVYPVEDGIVEDGYSDQRIIPFGIRKIELVPNESSNPQARPYTVVVNGRKVFAKGWNWVPLDVMYGAPRPQKLEHLLRLAQRAHVNLLRVWGGGLIETEAFYSLADRYGILVWQEFIQSSSGIDNYPSESPEFIDMMVREAEEIIPRRRNHPSLALWCGGNELTGDKNRPLDDEHPLLVALKAAVARLDPDRHWLPTSPTGPLFDNSLEAIERDPTGLHDVHGPWEYQGVIGQYELYNRSTSLLHSEFGVEGITNLKTLNVTIAPEHQFPVSLDNPHWQHLGAWWVKQPMWQQSFGDVNTVETLVRATQFLQAEGLRYALEADGRRKYQNSGTLPWQFNEPYPMAACTSAVDYYGEPKPVYYAVARAYQALQVSAKFATAAWKDQSHFAVEIWGNHSGETALGDKRLTARLVGLDGEIHAEWNTTVGIPGNRALILTSIEYSLENLNLFFLDLRLADTSGQTLALNRYPFTNAANLVPLLSAPPTELTLNTEVISDEWRVTITNAGTHAALFVWLEDSREPGLPGYAEFSDNYFCLFPKEEKQLLVSWVDVPAADRSLDVTGWNIEHRSIPEPKTR
jgi:beta-mannosidase